MLTRMHSSRMHTARLLTVSQHAMGRGVSSQLPGECVCRGGGLEGVSAQGCVADPPCGQNGRQV